MKKLLILILTFTLGQASFGRERCIVNRLQEQKGKFLYLDAMQREMLLSIN